MNIEKVVIEGKNLEVCDRNIADSNYVVYDNKIWSWFSKSGAGKYFVISLEKPSTKEIIHVKGDDYKNIKWVIKPTGYMSI